MFKIKFRHDNREEYLCFQMIKIHLLSRLSSERIKYWIENNPIREYSLTIYECQLFDKINKFHSNGYFSNNNQLNYSKIQSISITPFIPFLKFYQIIYSNLQFINSNQFYISSNLSSTFNKSNIGKYFIRNFLIKIKIFLRNNIRLFFLKKNPVLYRLDMLVDKLVCLFFRGSPASYINNDHWYSNS